MKKMIVFTLLLLTTILASCSQQNDPESLDVLVPTGSPQFSQLYLEGNVEDYDVFDLDVDTVQGAETLPSAFGSESHDIIFAPTNLGAKLIDTGVPYTFAAAITHGNLYLVSSSKIDSMSDLEGESITLFGQNSTPDIVLKSLIENADLDEDPTLDYVDSVQSALSEFQSEKADIVMLAEPMLSTLEAKNDGIHTYDLQDAWEEAFDKDSYPQSGVFIHDDVASEVSDSYLDALDESIQKANDSPEEVASLAETLDVPFEENILINAIPRSHLKFVHAQDSKEDLEFFFERILELNPALINDNLPDASFYLNHNEE